MTYYLLRTLAWIINHLPRPWTLQLGRALGGLLYLIFPYRKDVAWENICRGLPERSLRQRRAILMQCYQHFGMVIMDFPRLPTRFARQPEKSIVFDDKLFRDSRQEKRGTILMTGHIGNWELIPAVLAARGYSIVSIAVQQRGGAGRFVQETRHAGGCLTIPRKASSRTILEPLRQGNILGLAADQDARDQGIWVRFLGQPSARFRGGALFHLHTGAPLVFTVCTLERDGRYRVSSLPVATDSLPEESGKAIRILTQHFADLLTEIVRRHPEQYFWFHRMWKTRPQARKHSV